MRAAWPMALLLLVSAGSGCLSWFDDRPDFDREHERASDFALPYMSADQPRPESPEGAGYNLELVGYHNGFDDTGDANAIPAGGYYFELAVTDDYAYLARGSQRQAPGVEGTYGGFSILDIRDPTAPFLLSHFEAPSGSDIEVNADETLAFFGTQRNNIEEIVGRGASTQDPTSIAPRGIYVVDIEEKDNPTLEAFVPVPYNGVHTLSYVQHPDSNEEYVIVCYYDLHSNTIPISNLPGGVPVPGVNPATQRVIVFQIVDNPLPVPGLPRVQLVPVSEYQIPEAAPEPKMFFPHDTFVQKHPVDGRTLLYVAYWDKGVRILDFTDPTNLVELDGFTEFTPSSRNNIHQVKAFPQTIDGYHVTVTEPEIINADETGQITFLDTTAPDDIRKLGHWTQPNPDLVVSNLDFSPHNFDLWDGKVALAHYRAGVFIVDVSDEENLREPKTVGFYMSGIDRDDPPSPNPYAWSAFWKHGMVFVSEEATGLHILRYTGP